jgi:hypothetical protein
VILYTIGPRKGKAKQLKYFGYDTPHFLR